MSRYRFIETQRGHYCVRRLCQLVQVPASGYYAWQQTQQASKSEPAWETALVKVFDVHKRCYGTRRLRAAEVVCLLLSFRRATAAFDTVPEVEEVLD